MCSAQVSLHHAAWRIKIELMPFGEGTLSQISHLQQLLADPTMKHHQNTSEQTLHCHWIISPCNGLCESDIYFLFLPCGKNCVEPICGESKLNKGISVTEAMNVSLVLRCN